MTDPVDDRPVHVILSCAMSVDGAIDDTSPERLVLSNPADLDRVDELRARCDAILVGGGTLRADNPRLLIRSDARRDRRRTEGRSDNPLKVTLTRGSDLDPDARFFTTGPADKLVYCAAAATDALRRRLKDVAEVVGLEPRHGGAGKDENDGNDGNDENDGDRDEGRANGPNEELPLAALLADLARRGVRSLLVEGGSAVHTAFLTTDLADELHLAVAPFFVGDPAAPRFVGSGRFPHDPRHPMRLTEVRRIGDLVVLSYDLRT